MKTQDAVLEKLMPGAIGERVCTDLLVSYDESETLRCPACKTVMTWSSGLKKFCSACGFVEACCN